MNQTSWWWKLKLMTHWPFSSACFWHRKQVPVAWSQKPRHILPANNIGRHNKDGFPSLLNSWPLWAIEASDYSPLLSVVSELDDFRQCTVAPVCDVIRPSSWWSSDRSLTFHHQSLILHSADVVKQSQFPLLYQIDHAVVSFFSLSLIVLLLTLSFQHTLNIHLTPHLECQELSKVCRFDSPRLSCIDHPP